MIKKILTDVELKEKLKMYMNNLGIKLNALCFNYSEKDGKVKEIEGNVTANGKDYEIILDPEYYKYLRSEKFNIVINEIVRKLNIKINGMEYKKELLIFQKFEKHLTDAELKDKVKEIFLNKGCDYVNITLGYYIYRKPITLKRIGICLSKNNKKFETYIGPENYALMRSGEYKKVYYNIMDALETKQERISDTLLEIEEN